jgi:hypothetical protein
MKNEYPKYIYGAKGSDGKHAVRLVHEIDEHRALGGGWYESPADVPDVPEAPGAPVVTGGVVGSVAEIANEAARAVEGFYAAPAKIVTSRIAAFETVEEVDEIAGIEANRPGGARKAVLNAIAVRRAELSAPVDDPVGV